MHMNVMRIKLLQITAVQTLLNSKYFNAHYKFNTHPGEQGINLHYGIKLHTTVRK